MKTSGPSSAPTQRIIDASRYKRTAPDAFRKIAAARAEEFAFYQERWNNLQPWEPADLRTQYLGKMRSFWGQQSLSLSVKRSDLGRRSITLFNQQNNAEFSIFTAGCLMEEPAAVLRWAGFLPNNNFLAKLAANLPTKKIFGIFPSQEHLPKIIAGIFITPTGTLAIKLASGPSQITEDLLFTGVEAMAAFYSITKATVMLVK